MLVTVLRTGHSSVRCCLGANRSRGVAMLFRNLAYYVESCVFMIRVVTAKVFADKCRFPPPLPDASLGNVEDN
jgi:hypothetical protein